MLNFAGAIHSPRRNFVLLSAFLSLPLGVMAPLQLLIMVARGIDPALVGLTLGVSAVTVILAEVPTGVWADVAGYRRTLLTGALLMSLGVAVFALATHWWAFVIGGIVFSVGKACDSGALLAWYVEKTLSSTPQTEVDVELTSGLASASLASGVALAIGAITAGMSAALFDSWGLSAAGTELVIAMSVPLLGALALFLLYMVSLFILMEPDAPVERSGPPRSGFRLAHETVKNVVHVPVLRMFALRWLGLPFALTAFHLLTPLRLNELTGPAISAVLMGWLVALTYLLQGLCARLAPWLLKRFGIYLPSIVLTLLAGFALASISVLPHVAALSVMLVLFYSVSGPVTPLLGPVLHNAIPSGQRASILSIASVVRSAGGFVGALSLGLVAADLGARYGYLAAGAVMMACAYPLVAIQRHTTMAGISKRAKVGTPGA